MKLIVAIEIGEVTEDTIICGKNTSDDQPILLRELRKMPKGATIILDDADMRRCDYDDSFYKFEFWGIEE